MIYFKLNTAFIVFFLCSLICFTLVLISFYPFYSLRTLQIVHLTDALLNDNCILK